jgi:hypothetical protein
MVRGPLALVLFTLAGTAVAQADDPSRSQDFPVFDFPAEFKSTGNLIIDDTTPPAGINSGPGQTTAPATVFTLPFTTNWEFDIWYVVGGWGPVPGGDGAQGVMVGIGGAHVIPPPTHGEGRNDLPAIVGGEAIDGVGTPAPIKFDSSAVLSCWSTDEHGEHFDSYGVEVTAKAREADAGPPRRPRHMEGPYTIRAHHSEKPRDAEWYNGDGTIATTPDDGTIIRYDPSTRTLTLQLGVVSVMDDAGGATGGIAPQYGDDPLARRPMGELAMRYAGRDPETGAHTFEGGVFSVLGPDGSSAQVVGKVGSACIESTAPADPDEGLNNFATFERLWVLDTAEPDAWRSTWAEGFVSRGWFGEGLDPREAATRLFPILTIATDDGDLVDATGGFERRAEMRATVLLTIAIDPARTPPCDADLDGDGRLTVFDFLAFQNAFATGDRRADCDANGELDIFDFLCFQNAFDAGCP